VSLREPTWRTTTAELASAREEERGEGERVASYLISPFGARMNRVVVVGPLGAAEPLGRDDPPTFWRARLDDPLGSVAVTAGSFQPRAAAQLRSAPAGRPAIVVGKVHRYRPRDGEGTVSIRAEAVRPVAEAEERATLAEIVRQSLDRLDLVERLEHEPALTEATLRAGGHPALWIRGAREALRRYPGVDRAPYREALRAAIRRVAGIGGLLPPPGIPSEVRVTVDPAPAAAPARSGTDREEEAAFLGLVDAAAELSEDGYADVQELFRRLADRGVPADRAEAVLGRLEEDGLLQEPIVGKLRRA
jgi:uncharacterized protein